MDSLATPDGPTESAPVELDITIVDMVCSACEAAVERAALSLEGCSFARASLADGVVRVRFQHPCTVRLLVDAIGRAGYEAVPPRGSCSSDAEVDGRSSGVVSKEGAGDGADAPVVGPESRGGSLRAASGRRPPLATVGILVLVGAVFMVLETSGAAGLFQSNVSVQAQAGYAALFVVGLLTSVHCVAMCGGINLSQSLMGIEDRVPSAAGSGDPAEPGLRRILTRMPGWWDASRNGVLYNFGRIVGYTLVGALLGLLGDAVSPTLRVRATIGLLTGLAMLVAGLNMLGGFGLVRRLGSLMPRGLASPLRKLAARGPFFVGLANSLMPCGPLQAIQLYALATADAVVGALSMLAFCLGTVPLVLATGIVARTASLTWRRTMQTAGAALMLLLALFMVQNNLSILGVSTPGSRGTQVVSEEGFAISSQVGGVQLVTTDLGYNSFGDIEVVEGVPVRWSINADADHIINCNNEIVIAAFGVEQPLHEGENVIEFTPESSGSYPVTCWMGMLDNTVRVVPR